MSLKLRFHNGIHEVFDPVRKKFVALTPEEEVRQCMLIMLMEQLKVPAGLIAVERKIVYNGLTKRPDILIFSPEGNPLMLVECKAPNISLGKSVLYQAAAYHNVLPAKFLIFTNGIEFQVFSYSEEGQKLFALDFIPDFSQMTLGVV